MYHMHIFDLTVNSQYNNTKKFEKRFQRKHTPLIIKKNAKKYANMQETLHLRINNNKYTLHFDPRIEF